MEGALIAHIALLFVGLAFGNEVDDLMFRGQIDQAVLAARAVTQADHSVADDETYIDLLLSTGVAATAEHTYRAKLAAEPTNADNHYLLGRALVSAEGAAASYQAALRMDPTHARAQMGMGAVYRSRGDYAAAKAAYQRALDGDNTLGEAWSGLSAVFVLTKDYEGALAVARRALIATPKESSPYISIAILAPQEAVAILNQGAGAVPNDPMIFETLAEAHLARDEGKSALMAINKSLAIDPRRPASLTLALYADAMSRSLLDADGYADMVRARKQAIESPAAGLLALHVIAAKYPECGLVYMARASAYSAVGKPQSAAADLRTALILDPKNFEAHAALGMNLLNDGDASAALPHLVAASERMGGDVGLAVGLATARIATGDYTTARKSLEGLYGRHGKDVRVVLAYARVLAHDEEFESAYRLLKISLAGTMDGRVAIALAGAAQDVGRFNEAADLIQQLAEQTNDARLFRLAATIRAKAIK